MCESQCVSVHEFVCVLVPTCAGASVSVFGCILDEKEKKRKSLTYESPVAGTVYGSTVAGVPTRMMNVVVLYDMVVTLGNRT